MLLYKELAVYQARTIDAESPANKCKTVLVTGLQIIFYYWINKKWFPMLLGTHKVQ